MGLDPENPDYEVGDDNPTCHIFLFSSETPKYVEARAFDIDACLFPGLDPPNVSCLLTQGPTAGDWIGSVGNYTFGLELKPNLSRLLIYEPFGGAPWTWFIHDTNTECREVFTNQQICAGFIPGAVKW